jgi:hypothetical protein
MIAVMAWLLPGLGHWMVGQRCRGIVIGLTLGMLFTGGLLIGGIDVVDPNRDLVWFAPQAGVGPLAVGCGMWRGAISRQAEETGDVDHTMSIGRVNEMGTLYCAVAGVLNLLAILDAVHRQIDRESAQEGLA